MIAPVCFAAPARDLLKPPMIKSPLRSKAAKYELKQAAKRKIVLRTSKKQQRRVFTPVDKSPHFDLPVTYNKKVKTWIKYFQTNGRRSYKRWLERSHRYIPKIQPMLDRKGLPRDLVYLAMIESGFSPRAVSTASAVGYWQFIKPTAVRYGLKVNWWLDERRDFTKSTLAAATYLNDLYKMFDSWYLAASGYNMGEGRVRRLIKKYKTKNFWVLSKKRDFPKETREYIPKLIAAMLIAKQPKLYGFDTINPKTPYKYEYFAVPGGTDLENLAYYIGADKRLLKTMNSALVKGFVPQNVSSYAIRIPPGKLQKASEFVRASL